MHRNARLMCLRAYVPSRLVKSAWQPDFGWALFEEYPAATPTRHLPFFAARVSGSSCIGAYRPQGGDPARGTFSKALWRHGMRLRWARPIRTCAAITCIFPTAESSPANVPARADLKAQIPIRNLDPRTRAPLDRSTTPSHGYPQPNSPAGSRRPLLLHVHTRAAGKGATLPDSARSDHSSLPTPTPAEWADLPSPSHGLSASGIY
jgi:hypothetical protein